jgi:hypothetical protein
MGIYSFIAQAIPKITTDFESLLDVGWYGSAYTLARFVIFHSPIS